MKTEESRKKTETAAFDLRGLLAQCVKGNANWLGKMNGYVRTTMAAKLLKGEMGCPMPLSER
jgi:hypothetical protein